MAAQNQSLSQQTPTATEAVLGGPIFDPAKWLIVPARTFESLKVGEVFRMPSRTLTEAHTSAFQAVSLDNNPLHYDNEYAKKHGIKTALVVPLEVLAFAIPGASLFTLAIGEVLMRGPASPRTTWASVLWATPCMPRWRLPTLLRSRTRARSRWRSLSSINGEKWCLQARKSLS